MIKRRVDSGKMLSTVTWQKEGCEWNPRAGIAEFQIQDASILNQ